MSQWPQIRRPYNPSIGTIETIDYFTVAALALKAKIVVELGTGFGWSAGAFLRALEVTDGKLYSIDILEPSDPGLEQRKNTIKEFIAEWPNRFIFIQGDSVQVGKEWDKSNIDILLCDSDHSYEHVKNELNTWSKYNPKIIFVHDILTPQNTIAPPYEAAKQFAEQKGKIFYPFLNFSFGLGVVLYG